MADFEFDVGITVEEIRGDFEVVDESVRQLGSVVEAATNAFLGFEREAANTGIRLREMKGITNEVIDSYKGLVQAVSNTGFRTAALELFAPVSLELREMATSFRNANNAGNSFFSNMQKAAEQSVFSKVQAFTKLAGGNVAPGGFAGTVYGTSPNYPFAAGLGLDPSATTINPLGERVREGIGEEEQVTLPSPSLTSTLTGAAGTAFRLLTGGLTAEGAAGITINDLVSPAHMTISDQEARNRENRRANANKIVLQNARKSIAALRRNAAGQVGAIRERRAFSDFLRRQREPFERRRQRVENLLDLRLEAVDRQQFVDMQAADRMDPAADPVRQSMRQGMEERQYQINQRADQERKFLRNVAGDAQKRITNQERANEAQIREEREIRKVNTNLQKLIQAVVRQVPAALEVADSVK